MHIGYHVKLHKTMETTASMPQMAAGRLEAVTIKKKGYFTDIKNRRTQCL